jgi:hypothetical protein
MALPGTAVPSYDKNWVFTDLNNLIWKRGRVAAGLRERWLSDSEDPGVLRPVYFERIDFLGADITGKQERVVRSKSKPSPKRSGGQASGFL